MADEQNAAFARVTEHAETVAARAVYDAAQALNSATAIAAQSGLAVSISTETAHIFGTRYAIPRVNVGVMKPL